MWADCFSTVINIDYDGNNYLYMTMADGVNIVIIIRFLTESVQSHVSIVRASMRSFGGKILRPMDGG